MSGGDTGAGSAVAGAGASVGTGDSAAGVTAGIGRLGTFRTDAAYSDGRHPDQVRPGDLIATRVAGGELRSRVEDR